tara:strand:- start:776 stop:961 length:186 start_codon:yes stop_codon:yes gene_type:complete
MTLDFFSGLINVFSAKPGRREREFETWAKTEYRSDWQYAYRHMIEKGTGPKEHYLRMGKSN